MIYLRFGLYFRSHSNFVDIFELWVEYLQHHLFQRSVVKNLCSDYQIGQTDPKKKQEKKSFWTYEAKIKFCEFHENLLNYTYLYFNH